MTMDERFSPFQNHNGRERQKPWPAKGRSCEHQSLLDIAPTCNPQYGAATLIHKDVKISPVNYRVNAVSVFIEAP
jgi:hypothetical protein